MTLRFDVVTLFPEMVAAVTQSGITRRALERGLWQFEGWNPRLWAENSYGTVDDRTAAEKLDGMYIGAPREALPATDEDEFYWGDLVGLQVVNEAGELLGKVASLIEAGANQVLVVKDAVADKEHLLPFVAEVVKDVAVAEGRIRVAWGRDW